nr:hypothetical protein [Tanacetum cinerariifolium]
MDINIDALYNILKQNQGDVNDGMGSKKKTVVVTSDPLALIVEKTKVSKSKEKVVVSSSSEGSEADDFRDVNDGMGSKKKTVVVTSDPLALIVEKTKVSKSKEKVVVSSSSEGSEADDFKASSSSADEKTSEVSYYLSESESKSEIETSEYYDNSTNYGLFVNNDDDQEIFHDAIDSASENLIENHINSQKDYDKFDVDHNDSEEKDHLVDKISGQALQVLRLSRSQAGDDSTRKTHKLKHPKLNPSTYPPTELRAFTEFLTEPNG